MLNCLMNEAEHRTSQVRARSNKNKNQHTLYGSFKTSTQEFHTPRCDERHGHEPVDHVSRRTTNDQTESRRTRRWSRSTTVLACWSAKNPHRQRLTAVHCVPPQTRPSGSSRPFPPRRRVSMRSMQGRRRQTSPTALRSERSELWVGCVCST